MAVQEVLGSDVPVTVVPQPGSAEEIIGECESMINALPATAVPSFMADITNLNIDELRSLISDARPKIEEAKIGIDGSLKMVMT